MIFEFRNVQFVNKGAELMLLAMLEQINSFFPSAKIAMAPREIERPYEKRAKLGFLQKAWYWRYGVQWGRIAQFFPKKLLNMYGVVRDKDIDVVLDASGFLYTNQWGKRSCVEMADACRHWKKNGTKIVLLPQAFGPFLSHQNKEAIKVIADKADLIFTRERLSYNYLTGIVGERPNIKISPDFTNLIKGIVPSNFDKINNRFCIIPNYRMIDRTDKKVGDLYIPLMAVCVQHLIQKEQKPFFLIHDGDDDLRLAKNICAYFGTDIPIIQENDALHIKGIIGSCTGTIGSRFHGLVSALSQGVPSLAIGWSHKYKMLFEAYEFTDGIIDINDQKENILNKIDLLINPESRNSIKTILENRSEDQREQSRKMWELIFETISK